MRTDVVVSRREKSVWSYATGQHMPTPYAASDGRWRCRDCGEPLRTYVNEFGVRRLRHNSRRKVA